MSDRLQLGVARSTLGPAGELEWQRLRRQLELVEGFWLAFVLARSSSISRELRQRTRATLRARVRGFELIQPSTPAALRTAIEPLFAAIEAGRSLIWIESLHGDALGTDETPWQDAWRWLMMRLNERRDRIRRHLEGGLVFAGPPELKVWTRTAAPDLWSVRSLVLEMRPHPLASAGPPEAREMEVALGRSENTASELTSPGSLSQEKPTAEETEAIQWMRRAEGALLSGRGHKAIQLAAKAVQALEQASEPGAERLASGLELLARAEEAEGDLAAAYRHLGRALELIESPTRRRLLWLDRRRELASQLGELEEASRLGEEALLLARQRAQEESTEESLRDLSISLERIADLQTEQGQTQEALQAYQEGLQLRRQLLQEFGEAHQTLRDLSISLERIADLQLEQGHTQEALQAYHESLQLRMRLLQEFGESPQTLRDLSASFLRIAKVESLQGSLQSARERLEESLSLNERCLAAFAETPLLLRDRSELLDQVAEIRERLGDDAGAEAARQERMEIEARLEAAYGS